MPQFSNSHTNTYHTAAIVTRLILTFFQFSKLCHMITIVTGLHVTLFQNSHNHIHIFPIVRRYVVIFIQFSENHMSHYSNFQKTTYNIIPIFTRPPVTSFQLSHDIISFFPIFPPPHIILYQNT